MTARHSKLLPIVAALLWLGSPPTQAAVTVYEVSFSQRAMRLNPAVFMTINGAALPPAGTPGLTTYMAGD